MFSRVAESEVFGWSRIPNNTEELESDFFVRLRISNLSFEFLLKWCNFF